MTTKANAFLPVQFRLFSIFTHGKNKGKPDPASFHTVTLLRYVDYINPAQSESVGFTLKRAKEMVQGTSSRVTIVNPGPETEAERIARREKHGLEVVSEVLPIINAAKEAGDTTFIQPGTLTGNHQVNEVAA